MAGTMKNAFLGKCRSGYCYLFLVDRGFVGLLTACTILTSAAVMLVILLAFYYCISTESLVYMRFDSGGFACDSSVIRV